MTIDDLELASHPATVRINRARKRDGNNAYHVGSTKAGAGKRTVSLPPAMVEHLTPLTAGRRGSELLLISESGGRIVHSTFWQEAWIPVVTAAHETGLAKTPRIHELRHTGASWLIHEGVPDSTISRRLGHVTTSTSEKIYGHLRPQTLQEAADAIDRSARLLREQRDT